LLSALSFDYYVSLTFLILLCRRYNLDAAILFSDILVLLQALSIPVTMPGGVGIQVPNPVESVSAAKTLIEEFKEQVKSPEFVKDKLGHVLEAITLILGKLQSESISIPLIGFSAAPYTLMYYMLGGTSKKHKDVGMTWLRENEETARELMELLTDLVIEYCSMQVRRVEEERKRRLIKQRFRAASLNNVLVPPLQRVFENVRLSSPISSPARFHSVTNN